MLTSKVFQHFRLGGTSSYQIPQRCLSGQRLTYSQFGDPSHVVKMESCQLDALQDQTVVQMLASPINPADMNTIQGVYPVKPKRFPSVPGNEGVGVVTQVGSGPNESGISLGDWVIPLSPLAGTWQSFMIGKNTDFLKLSNQMNLVSAATISVNPCTACRMLKDFEQLKPEDTVIQNGGNSAVGQAVIQLCRELSFKSISVVRARPDFPQLKKKLEGLGNSNTLIITEEELRKKPEFKAQLGLNCVGGKATTDMLRTLDKGRTLVTYGGMSRQPITVPTSALIFNDIKLAGFWMTRYNSTTNLQLRQEMLDFFVELDLEGKWIPPENEIVPIEDYKTALENSMKGFSGVKYILKFN